MANGSTEPTQQQAWVPVYFQEALDDAERLLKHAAEVGVDIDPDLRTAVLHARVLPLDQWTEDVAAKLLVALTAMAAALKPVTAASLKASHSDARPTMRHYLVWAIILSIVIIPSSILTFVTSSLSESIRTDVTKANGLAVKLRAELGPPPDVNLGTSDKVADLTDYAATVRSIYSRSHRLNSLVFPHVEVPPPLLCGGKEVVEAECLKQKFELPVKLEDLAGARDQMTETYQDVRFFAQTITNDVLTFYGAINSCILPVLYALLGTCAFLLRTFEDQMSTRTFVPTVANSARFLIAAIGGTVIGLFSGYTSTASASPLAIAFLVGYGVEIFFAFLEGLIRSFTKGAYQSNAGAGKS